jgi:hypothetical protein
MSHLEDLLVWHIRARGLPPAKREWRIVGDRRFRWDLAWPDARLAVEVQGGIWIKGGHTTGGGILRDIEKHNLATLAGWRILYATRESIEAGVAVRQIERALEEWHYEK